MTWSLRVVPPLYGSSSAGGPHEQTVARSSVRIAAMTQGRELGTLPPRDTHPAASTLRACTGPVGLGRGLHAGLKPGAATGITRLGAREGKTHCSQNPNGANANPPHAARVRR